MKQNITKGALPPMAMRFTPQQAAAYTGLTPRTLKAYRQERRIPYYAVGHRTVLFDRRDLDAFLAARRVESIGM